MRKKKLLSAILAIVLCVAMILPLVPIEASAAALDNFDMNGDFAGLNLSVIGDSITTFYGVSNSKTYNPLYLSTSEATFGTYYGNTSHGDYADFSHITRADTWWQQTADTLGMNLLVNNAWSGSFVLIDQGQSNTTEYGAAAYKARCVNLHNGSKKPDIIGVYLGTNDIAYYDELTVGTRRDIDTASERSALYTSVNNYKTPTSSVQAYFIMLNRMIATYPDAEIYCMLPSICLNAMGNGRRNALNEFNDAVTYMVDYFAGQGKKVYLVDLNHDCGLVNVDVVRAHYYCNNVHPDKAGMDMITACLISEIQEHSSKGKGTSNIHPVEYNLSDTFVKTGMTRYAVEGKSFSIDLLPYEDGKPIDLVVTMKDAATGKFVQIPGGGVRGESVYIPQVTGPVSITAKPAGKAYHWKATQPAFVGVYGKDLSYNGISLLSGSYTGGTDTGAFTTAQYSLTEPVVLKHDRPWEMEFKGGGGTFAGGILMLSDTADSSTSGNTYVHITQSNVFLGYRDSVGYNNSGISWETIASKLGSTAGADIRNETHVFRLVNVPNGLNNAVYLYVDGVQIGTMDGVKMIGSSATHESVGDINISGKDFVFNYIGSASHPIQNCSFSYIKIWENGKTDASSELPKYRWELSSGKNSLISVDNEEFTENDPILLSGSVSGGTFTGTSYALEKPVVLMHDRAWSIRWEAEGSWVDAQNGGMMLATSLYYKDNDAPYIYIRPNSELVSIGEWHNGQHENYGIYVTDHGIDGSAKHTYELVNEVSGSSNMVYLYVDGVKLGAMDNYHVGSNSQNTKSTWISGKDFVFSYIGTSAFTVGGCTINYIEVNTDCVHSFGDWEVLEPDCWNPGTKTRTCGTCGETEVEVTPAKGHSYVATEVAATCYVPAHTAYMCSVCADNYNVFADAQMSEWSAVKPDVDEALIEKKIQYRYADKVTTTSYATSLDGYTRIGGEWDISSGVEGSVQYVNNWPAGFDTSNSLYSQYNKKSAKVTEMETDTTKTVVTSDFVTGYLQYHWCYTSSVNSMPSKTGSYTTFHGYHTTIIPDYYTFDASDDSYRTCHSGCTNSNWYFPIEVNTQKYITYKKLFTYEGWGDWSAWSDTVAEASDSRIVETQTLYRYVAEDYENHSWQNGICGGCGTVCQHPSYENNLCTVCGKEKPVDVDYYLFGYINGKNYGCEEDFANLGEYKFVNGQVTVKFNQTSYVAVKTSDNKNWYMTNGYPGNYVNKATLYNTSVLGTNADKMHVPGGVTVTFTLVDNGDDTFHLSYVGVQEETPDPVITLKYPTLSFEGEVFYNVYFTTQDLDVDVADMGLLTWYNRPANTASATYETAEEIIPGATYNAGADMYMVRSQGVPAKKLGDNMYLRIYAKLSDGSYVYSPVTYYNAKFYASDILANSQNEDMKSLVVAMLNYGAAAQVHFNHNADNLMNADLTAAQKALAKDFSNEMISTVVSPDSAKTANFKSNGGFSGGYPSVSFDGAFSINFYLTPKKAIENEMTMYCWNLKTYNSVSALTEANANAKVTMVPATNPAEYFANYTGIAAKQIDETVFVAGVYTSGGVRYSSPVMCYSLSAYCADQIANGTATMQDFAKATVVYGDAAKTYFASISQ